MDENVFHVSKATDRERINEALDWQDKDIGSEQKSRIENHFKLNSEAVKKSDFSKVLQVLVDEFPNMQERIASKRSECEYDKKTDSFDDLDRAGTEMLCGASTTAVWQELTTIVHNSNVYHGVYDNKEGNHRRHPTWKEISHVFIELDDGTIIDPAYGQMYPPEVNINADMRLRIISHDDPEHENYKPEYRSYPFLNTTRKLTEDNNYGKDLPRSEVANIKGDWRKATKNPKDVRVRIGYTSPEERKKIKESLKLINSFPHDQLEHAITRSALERNYMKEIELVKDIKKILEE